MQKPLGPQSSATREPSLPRSLQTLNQDHTRFLEDGQGNLKKAKEFNNVIGTPFFNIPIDHVRY